MLLVPWTVRNADRFHRFIPIRTGIGQNLWEGLGEVHNNFGAVLDDQVTLNQVHAVRPDLVYGSPAYDSYLEHKAVTAIREHPGVMLHAVARRVAITTFGLHTLPGALGILEPTPAVLAALIAVLTRHRFGREGLLLAAVPIATILPYLLLHVEGRLRAPGVVREDSDLGWPGRGSRLTNAWPRRTRRGSATLRPLRLGRPPGR